MSGSVPLVRIGGSRSLGITLPKDELEQRGIVAGDQVVLILTEDPDAFTVYVPTDE